MLVSSYDSSRLDSNWIQNEETLSLNSFYTIITMVIMGFIFLAL